MMYSVKFLSAALLSSLIAGTALAGEAHQPQTVVELYTSQGCSSCPPADKLMGKLTKNPDILGLSFAVTYWDYIGWKDTFGSPDNDIRQTRYRDQFSGRYVYTPQMVVAGRDHFVGSNAHELESNLHKFKGHARQIPLKWRFEGEKLIISLPDHGTPATIWQVDIDHEKKVQIGRGENTGKSVTYHNVVRKTRQITDWDGKAKTISLDLTTLMQEGRDGCAILVQERGFGPIVAALQIGL